MEYYKNLELSLKSLQYIPVKQQEIEYHKEQIRKYKKSIDEIRMEVFQCLYPGMEVKYEGQNFFIEKMAIDKEKEDAFITLKHKDKSCECVNLEKIAELEFNFEEE